MQHKMIVIHDQKRKAIHFTEGKLQGADLWFPYDASTTALSSAIGNLLTLNGVATKVIGVERIRQCGVCEDLEITYVSDSCPLQAPIEIATNQHPDGHCANATMSCLENDVCVSVAVHLNRDYFKNHIETLPVEILTTLRPIAACEGIASINVEIGDNDGQ